MTDYADQAPPRRQYQDETESTGGNKSIGEAVGDVTRDMSVLVQQELALAKAEVRQSASRAGQAAGMFAGAAVASFLFVVFLSIALWVTISDNTGPAWAAVIVAAIWLVAAGILFSGCSRPSEEDQRIDSRRPRLCAKFRTHSKDMRREIDDHQQRPG